MASGASEVLGVKAATGGLARFADRWIWVFMATLLIGVVLAGFIPDSIMNLHAIQAQKRPPFAWFLHIHAVVMGSWMLVLLAQTVLMATGRRQGHASLGMASLALAPLVVLMMIVMSSATYGFLLPGPLQNTALPQLSFGLGLVLFVQGRSIILFTLFYTWGFLSRRTQLESHKRLMLLATWSMVDAALARIPGADELALDLGLKTLGLDGHNDPSQVWLLVLLLPVLLYDLIRRGRIHYTWVVGIASFLPFFAMTHIMTKPPPWWLHVLAEITGRA